MTRPAHLVLARKYRPLKFSDVVEQATAVRALQNAALEDRIGSAYLFFGPRGVGKTTIARILARRINCTNPQEGEPCNECLSCKSILDGRSLDVIEIDAASNRRIEDVRELRENVKFQPMNSKRKVYIIDEVHMLTTESFNALLKTLEEPPEHAAFVLATTELNKVPETILSRCQVFTFRKVPLHRVQEYMAQICKKENIEAESDALFWIARKGDGSVRDSLSFLEQAISFCGTKITAEKVRELAGVYPLELFLQLTGLLLDPATPSQDLATPVMEIFDQGGDLNRFIWDYLDHLRILRYIRSGVEDSDFLGIPGSQIQNIKTESANFDPARISLIFDEIHSLLTTAFFLKLRNSYESRILIEMELLKIHDRLKKPSVSALLSKIQKLSVSLAGQDSRRSEDLLSDITEDPPAPIGGPPGQGPPRNSSGSAGDTGKAPQSSSGQEASNPSGDFRSGKAGAGQDIPIEDELQKQFLGTMVDPDSVPEEPQE
ncbi:MAG: DNA polymerase III subunit gamma/tau [Leptospiraceae bacterium]|nr:DNA polymerase III subunit gamma/tau [Leptospiraceae bacterium]